MTIMTISIGDNGFMAASRSGSTIGELWQTAGGRPAGFDNLRVIFAFSVILFHTVLVCYGIPGETWFWTGPLRPLVYCVVPGFFALSGFLVTGSLIRNDLLSFASLRLLRIYPALAFEVLLSAFLIGSFVTENPLRRYFFRTNFLRYLENAVGLIHYSLPGVFLHNPFGNVVNIQLWTVPFELECYALLIFLALIGLHRRPALFLVATIILTIVECLIIALTRSFPQIDARPPGQMTVLCFLFGVALFLLKDRIKVNAAYAMAAFVAFAVLIYNGYGIYASAPFIAYTTICIGVQNRRLPLVAPLTNYSYGIYLYGFPMQQLVAYLLPQYRFWWVNLALSIPMTIGAATISWHVVEKPVDKHKRAIIGYLLALRSDALARWSEFFGGKRSSNEAAMVAPGIDA